MSNTTRDHHWQSLRLSKYDYSSPGAYFITCITAHRVKLFGEVVQSEMILNPFGRIITAAWNDLPSYYPLLRLDRWVVMPDHRHGIIVIEDDTAFSQSYIQHLRAGLRGGHSNVTELTAPHLRGEEVEAVSQCIVLMHR